MNPASFSLNRRQLIESVRRERLTSSTEIPGLTRHSASTKWVFVQSQFCFDVSVSSILSDCSSDRVSSEDEDSEGTVFRLVCRLAVLEEQ